MNILPYTHLPRYPHMGNQDALIWDRYITAYPKQFSQVAYDVKVGVGHAPPPGMAENYKIMQAALSKKRIDVIGFSTRKATIIEVKPYASLSAVGQVQVYSFLFKAISNKRLQIDQLILCEQYDADIIAYCNSQQIEVHTI